MHDIVYVSQDANRNNMVQLVPLGQLLQSTQVSQSLQLPQML